MILTEEETRKIINNPAALNELKKNLAESSLYYFARFAWGELFQGRKFIDNWHIEAVCEHLEAVYNNEIQFLLINIPVRCMKSLLISVLFHAWGWVKDPSLQFLTLSHDEMLATRNGVDARGLILSDWYKQNWGDRVTILPDQAQKTYYKNTAGGHRLSKGINTKITGHNCDIVLADDPHSGIDVISKVEREKTIESFKGQVMTRFNNADTARAVITMQRLHFEDLSAVYENDPDWEHLCIPMEYENENRSRTSLHFKDPRKEKNELLWPERFPQKWLDRFKPPKYPATHFASQFQQRPTPLEGGIIQHDWIKFYVELPEIKSLVWSWDTAIKAGQENDFSVGTLWAVCSNGYYLIDMYREKVEYPALRRMVEGLYNSAKNEYSKINEVLIEDKASGQQLVQDFKALRIPVIPMMPGKTMAKTKIERLTFCSSQFEAGKVYLPKEKPWVIEVVNELTQFPNAPHDDIVDSITQFLSRKMYKSGDGPRIRRLR